MLKVVLDTNLIISALFWGGIPGKLLAFAEENKLILLTSSALLDELSDVLQRPKFEPRLAILQKSAAEIVEDIKGASFIVAPAEIPPTAPDPDDDAVLACAVGGQADHIVTGDKGLLSVGTIQNIPISDPATFLASFDVESER